MKYSISDYSKKLIVKQKNSITFGGSLILIGWIGFNIYGVYSQINRGYSFIGVIRHLAPHQVLLLVGITALIVSSVILPVTRVQKRLISAIRFHPNNPFDWVMEIINHKEVSVHITSKHLKKSANFWYYLFFDNKTTTFSLLKQKGSMDRYEVISDDGQKYLLIPLLFEQPSEIAELLNEVNHNNRLLL